MQNTVLSPFDLVVVIGVCVTIGSYIPIVVNGIWEIVRAKRITRACRKAERESLNRIAAMQKDPTHECTAATEDIVTNCTICQAQIVQSKEGE